MLINSKGCFAVLLLSNSTVGNFSAPGNKLPGKIEPWVKAA